MGDRTGIEWTTRTWNPWRGCTKVSPGCDNCYMFREQRRYGRDPEVVTRCSPATFNAPLRWQRQADQEDRQGEFVFTCSWSDWFHKAADAWRDEAWAIVRRTPRLIYQILTKRPALIRRRLPADWGEGYPNVWLGVSAEDRPRWDQRVPLLREIPAAVRFVSVEPQLGDIRLRPEDLEGIDWVIVGGEGYGARPFDLQWARSTIAVCRKTGTACFVKQAGANVRTRNDDSWLADADVHVGDSEMWQGAPVRVRLRHPKGGDPNEWPEDLRVRQFPEALR